MNKIQFNSELTSFPIALGCMRIAGMEEAKAESLIQTSLDLGIDLFDHADIYGQGESERLFGRVLKNNPGMRQKMLLQSKCGIQKGYYDASAAHIQTAVEGILQRLGVSELDLLLLHRPDTLMDPDEIAEAFTALHQSGKVRFFGVSNQNTAQMEMLADCLPGGLLVNQLQFGLAHTGIVDSGIHVNTLNPQAVDRDGGVLEYCRRHHVTIQAWSPFQYGWFEGVFFNNDAYAQLNQQLAQIAAEQGVTASAVAIAWIMRHPANMQTIVGTTNETRLAEICRATDVSLSRQEWYGLYQAAGNPLP